MREGERNLENDQSERLRRALDTLVEYLLSIPLPSTEVADSTDDLQTQKARQQHQETLEDTAQPVST